MLAERRLARAVAEEASDELVERKSGDFPVLAFCFWARSIKCRESSRAKEEESGVLCQLPILLCFSELD